MNATATVVTAIGTSGSGTLRRPGRPGFDGKSLQRSAAAVVVVTTSLMGCTMLQPIAGTPPELRQRIATGELLKSGDGVAIGTADGREYKFTVKAVDSGTIHGKHDSIPIDQVMFVHKREFSAGKTACLVLGILTVGDIIVAIATAPAAILSMAP
jgi:hypothetical protein